MTATLRFQLPDEDYEYKCAVRGIDYRRTLDEITDNIRHARKYGELTGEKAAAYDEVWEMIWRVRQEELEDE